MQKARFTETKIIAILKEAESGMLVKVVCRKQGISDATYYNCEPNQNAISNVSLPPSSTISKILLYHHAPSPKLACHGNFLRDEDRRVTSCQK